MAIGISIFRKHIHDLRQMRAEDKTIHLFIHKHLIIRLSQRFAITSHCRDAKFCVSTAHAQTKAFIGIIIPMDQNNLDYYISKYRTYFQLVHNSEVIYQILFYWPIQSVWYKYTKIYNHVSLRIYTL